MIVLELFSGSRNVSKTFESFGFDSISIDNNCRLNPSICCDILNFDLKLLPGNVSIIWASVPCTTFSRDASHKHFSKKSFKYRQYIYLPETSKARLSIELLEKTVDIILRYPECLFFIENPVGRMHHFPALKKLGHYRYFVNYASFGTGYSKETYIFTNMFLPLPTKKYFVNAPGLRSIKTAYKRSIVPVDLVKFIINHLPYGTFKIS